MNIRRWSVALDGHERTIELEHRTWWHRAIVRVDDRVVANRSINLAVGYDHAADVSVAVGDHRLDLAIRTDGALRPTYHYALDVDGSPIAGSDDVTPAPPTPRRPTLVGVTETIIWVSIIAAAASSLASEPLRGLALIVAGVIVSLILHRTATPPSWRIVGAILVFAAWVVGIAVVAGAYDPPRGL